MRGTDAAPAGVIRSQTLTDTALLAPTPDNTTVAPPTRILTPESSNLSRQLVFIRWSTLISCHIGTISTTSSSSCAQLRLCAETGCWVRTGYGMPGGKRGCARKMATPHLGNKVSSFRPPSLCRVVLCTCGIHKEQAAARSGWDSSVWGLPLTFSTSASHIESHVESGLIFLHPPWHAAAAASGWHGRSA